jgi:hypothetical protein
LLFPGLVPWPARVDSNGSVVWQEQDYHRRADGVIEKLGACKRPQVRVTIDGFSFETTVGVMGGRFKIPVSAERRQAAGVDAGDDLLVDVSLA